MSCVHCIGPWLRQVASAGHFAHLSEILVRMPRYAHIYGSGPLERTIVCLVLSSQCHARSTCRSAYTLNVHTTGRLSGAGYTGSGRCGRRHAVSASVCAYLRLSRPFELILVCRARRSHWRVRSVRWSICALTRCVVGQCVRHDFHVVWSFGDKEHHVNHGRRFGATLNRPRSSSSGR